MKKTPFCLVSVFLCLMSSFANSDVQVAIVKLGQQNLPIRNILAKVVTPQRQQISAEVAGVVRSRRLEMGAPIRAGQILVEVDSDEQQVLLEIAERELRSKEVDLAHARKMWERAVSNRKHKAISEARFDDAVTQLNKAQALKDLSVSAVALQKTLLEKYQIRAPFTGALVNSTPVVGLYVRPGDVIGELVNTDTLRIVAPLTNEELAGIRRADLSLLCGNNFLEIVSVSPVSNESSGFVDVEMTPCPQKLRVGQRVVLNLVQQDLSNFPQQGIQTDTGGKFVYIVTEGIAKRRRLKELSIGDNIIVVGMKKVRDGDRVQTIVLELDS